MTGPTLRFVFTKADLTPYECSSCQQERPILSITPQNANRPLHIELGPPHPGRASGLFTEE